jgi:ribonuclease-3
MKSISNAKLSECQRRLEYTFQSIGWLEKALTHPSNKFDDGRSNERLEFLGDAILGMVISEHLFETFDERPEGHLTFIKSIVVSKPALARRSKSLGLDQFVSVGKGMIESGVLPESVLANVLEAIIAAIYIDGGLPEARRFVLQNLAEEIARVEAEEHERNYKSILQQYAQRELNSTPTYRVIGHSGPDHQRSFQVVTVINGKTYESAWGQSKKEAEQRSAELTYDKLLQERARQSTEV